MSNSSQTPVLPRLLDPRKFAQQRVDISGQVDLLKLERLKPLLANTTGSITASLSFGVDEQGIKNVTGTVHSEIAMICQRCLDAAVQSVEVSVNLGIVWSDEQAAALAKSWDPWILDEGQADIYEMIEDELILGLPIVAYHTDNCLDPELYSSQTDELESMTSDSAEFEEEINKPNPFQVLEELKGSLDKNPDNTDPNKTKH